MLSPGFAATAPAVQLREAAHSPPLEAAWANGLAKAFADLQAAIPGAAKRVADAAATGSAPGEAASASKRVCRTTKMCQPYLMGGCPKGDDCIDAHSEEELARSLRTPLLGLGASSSSSSSPAAPRPPASTSLPAAWATGLLAAAAAASTLAVSPAVLAAAGLPGRAPPPVPLQARAPDPAASVWAAAAAAAAAAAGPAPGAPATAAGAPEAAAAVAAPNEEVNWEEYAAAVAAAAASAEARAGAAAAAAVAAATEVVAGSDPLGRSIYKQSICRFFQNGRCSRGSGCSFAHGEHELTPRNLRVPRGANAARAGALIESSLRAQAAMQEAAAAEAAAAVALAAAQEAMGAATAQEAGLPGFPGFPVASQQQGGADLAALLQVDPTVDAGGDPTTTALAWAAALRNAGVGAEAEDPGATVMALANAAALVEWQQQVLQMQAEQDAAKKQKSQEAQMQLEFLRPSFKTQMCKFFPVGKCMKGSSCTYAHGDKDLRPYIRGRPSSVSSLALKARVAAEKEKEMRGDGAKK